MCPFGRRAGLDQRGAGAPGSRRKDRRGGEAELLVLAAYPLGGLTSPNRQVEYIVASQAAAPSRGQPPFRHVSQVSPDVRLASNKAPFAEHPKDISGDETCTTVFSFTFSLPSPFAFVTGKEDPLSTMRAILLVAQLLKRLTAPTEPPPQGALPTGLVSCPSDAMCRDPEVEDRHVKETGSTASRIAAQEKETISELR
ncbi:hypothetical protein GGTG_07187 [Gaeumannomyces tritici R3-111a-1]|uniref:Uncharacterized protein n=1 Tax=Gaeumannomyces tritici (strain R3-111a-1) TaxID=644352 RepID=J3P0Z1_GAET3|nr:hypothetical protein GGTG_07187 [Gaeumannomyces tritici R3-111a-1]EJT77275.1 hypothetical protein GGTG_07187 [Gaeumannomyces tritici R3-111a-1]